MKCHIHTGKDAVGTCVGCGKFICCDCNTEIKGKNYCKKCINEIIDEKSKRIENLENKSNTNNSVPMVFMNSSGGGGGGGGGSSSSSSSSSSVNGRQYAPPYPTNSVLMHLLLFFFTAGIGNIIYFLHIRDKQNRWNATYR